MEDRDLLEAFVKYRSDAAFREIVNRYAPMVYSSARQRLADPAQAEDISQAVFLALATKARKLSKDTVLCGWLFRATRYAVAEHIRNESRRKEREMRAQQEDALYTGTDAEDVPWESLAPHLAEGLDALAESDRQAILLRFYQGRSQAEVGGVLGVSEDAARKRIARGLERLRRFFGKRGLLTTTAGLTAVMSARAVDAVPAELGASVAEAALTGVAGKAAGTTAAVAKGVLNMMFWSQVKVASVAVLGAATVVAAGAAVTNHLTAPPPKVAHATEVPPVDKSGQVTMELAVIPDTWPASDLREEIARSRQVLKDSPASKEASAAHRRLEMIGTKIGATGGDTEVGRPFLAVTVRNGTSSNLYVNLLDTFRPTLTNADGKEIPLDGGRDVTRVPRPLSVLSGSSAAVRFPVRFLKQPAKEFPSVIIDDRTGGVWVFHDLKPGTYTMNLSYKNDAEDLRFGGSIRKRWPDIPADASFWVGAVTTSVATITVSVADGPAGGAAKRTTTTVRIPYHEQSLTADDVSMNREGQEIDAKGHVVLSNAVFVVTADSGRVRGNIETSPGAGNAISKAEWTATGNVCVVWAKRQVMCSELTFSESRAEVSMDGDTISMPGGPVDLAVLAERMLALGAAREWLAALKAQDLKRYQEAFHPESRKVGELASEEAMRFWKKQVDEIRGKSTAIVRLVCSPVSRLEATDRSPEGTVRAFFTVDGRKTKNSILLMAADDGWKVARLDF